MSEQLTCNLFEDRPGFANDREAWIHLETYHPDELLQAEMEELDAEGRKHDRP